MAVVYRCVGILTVDVVVFFRSPVVFHSQVSFPSTFRPRSEPLQRTHLQRPLLKISPTAGDETSRGMKPENGSRRDFGRRRRHRQSGFQHTDRSRPSSPELFNKVHSAGRESLSHDFYFANFAFYFTNSVMNTFFASDFFT